MSTKKRHEGYLMVDHRESPGLSEADCHAAGRPLNSGRGLFEASTITCNHCCVVVVLNPLRARPREWCSKCDRYVCDNCSAIMARTGACLSVAEIVERAQAAASRGQTFSVASLLER